MGSGVSVQFYGWAVNGSVIVAFVGLDKSAHFSCIILILSMGRRISSLSLVINDLDEMSTFENLVTLFRELLDSGYYYLCDYFPLIFLLLSFAKCIELSEDIYLWLFVSQFSYTLNLFQLDHGLNIYVI